jgi:predicted chitinase
MAVADSAGYFWVSKIMVSPNTGALRNGMNINRRADVGGWNGNVAVITTPVNGGSTGLGERQPFHCEGCAVARCASGSPKFR